MFAVLPTRRARHRAIAWRRVTTLTTLTLTLVAVSLRGETVAWPLTALDLARQRSLGIQCVSQLRQTVLAARLWSIDHGGQGPPGIPAFTNELGSPALLSCPANSGHPVATNWATFDWRWNDYEWLPAADWYNPAAVCGRCRIHDTVGRVDGSVQWLGGYRHGWPEIVAGPLNQQATPGSPVQFEVRVTPAAELPVTYQWRRHQLSFVTNMTFTPDPDDPEGGFWRTNRLGTFSVMVLTGETNASYFITETRPDHSDYYSVQVSNALGATTSRESQLLVDPAVAFRATNHYWSALHCASRLKQIALLGRIWANDRDERLPPSLAAMTNSLGLPLFGWPTLLYCRFDTARSVPADWAGVDFTNTSYEILPVTRPVDEDPSATFCRCRVHGFRARADGAVESRPRFTAIRSPAGGTTELAFEIFAGQTSVLEASTDLVNWARLNSFATNGIISIAETNPPPRRFYRIRTE